MSVLVNEETRVGSASFRMVRQLVRRLPLMVTPQWVRPPAQPIAIEDLLDYLERALDVELPETGVQATLA